VKQIMDAQANSSPLALVDDPALAAELKQLGDKLGSRQSVTAFARSYALTCAGVIVLGIATKLFVESARVPHFFWPIAVVGLGCVVGAVTSVLAGRRLQVSERAEFARYRELRTRAGLDA